MPTQFETFMMKRGFMLILLIRHDDVLGCYALEQGIRPWLMACDAHIISLSLCLSVSLSLSPSLSVSLFPFFIVQTVNVCAQRNTCSNRRHGHTHTHTHRSDAQACTCSTFVLWFKGSWKIYPATFSLSLSLSLSHTHTYTHTHTSPSHHPYKHFIIMSFYILVCHSTFPASLIQARV